jgi:hypothetical protein
MEILFEGFKKVVTVTRNPTDLNPHASFEAKDPQGESQLQAGMKTAATGSVRFHLLAGVRIPE